MGHKSFPFLFYTKVKFTFQIDIYKQKIRKRKKSYCFRKTKKICNLNEVVFSFYLKLARFTFLFCFVMIDSTELKNKHE